MENREMENQNLKISIFAFAFRFPWVLGGFSMPRAP